MDDGERTSILTSSARGTRTASTRLRPGPILFTFHKTFAASSRLLAEHLASRNASISSLLLALLCATATTWGTSPVFLRHISTTGLGTRAAQRRPSVPSFPQAITPVWAACLGTTIRVQWAPFWFLTRWGFSRLQHRTSILSARRSSQDPQSIWVMERRFLSSQRTVRQATFTSQK